MSRILIIITILFSSFVFSQTKEETARDKENQEMLSRAQNDMAQEDFASAEAKYRKVIALDPKNTKAKYNLGNAYYKNGKNTQATKKFIQAAEVAQTKTEKHKIYHNLGNTFMNDKKYREAVEAYKNALRNNPDDDETRYNLALAKKMLEEQGDSGGGGDDEKEENQDEKQEGDTEEEQDKGDEGNENEDKGDEGDDEQNTPEKDEEGDPKKEKQEEGQQNPQPVEGKLSPQQIKSLLEAMNNEEKKVQDKINAEKQKGVKVKPEKDW